MFNLKEEEEFKSLSIHSIHRRVDRQENSLFNHLRSIDLDSKFVNDIALCYSKYALVANLRCGAWYSANFKYSCYFRSTDGHYGNWRFSLTRLNLNIIDLVLKYDGCLIVDSTKRGKKFPDSFTRTIPIWIAVINRCLYKLKSESIQTVMNDNLIAEQWNQLYTPKWVTDSERDQMLKMVDSYCKLLMEHADTLDLKSYSSRLHKPLRPLWLSVETQPIILEFEQQQQQQQTSNNNNNNNNDDDKEEQLDFHPLYLLSCSDFREDHKSFRAYIQGAGDDDENWSMGLTPQMYWSNHKEIMSQENDEQLEQYIQQLVKSERTKKDIIIFNSNSNNNNNEDKQKETIIEESNEFKTIDNTYITISSSKELTDIWNRFDLIINCSIVNYVIDNQDDDKIKNNYIHIPMKEGKLAKNDLVENLRLCEQWLLSKMKDDTKRNRILIHSINGLQNCVCVLSVLLSKHLHLFTDSLESFDFFNRNKLTKSDIIKLYLFLEKQSPSSLPHKSIRNAINNYLLSTNISYK
ncbi:Putative initiator tRNA phosphoribosyl-transferase [Heterostelium album PN500]|uniref:Initiator tRNA phosphoribosyl-transferase n=1 Tax=Heterostelium pallidum (strain ATCC 26659 / Pp 5 / PN500) TaxID=670386 RepID=D3B088_HETP5|nr:Putative initiator tRNA phosphoribosyl-transferase [Heterostelium album PN500]EFA84712.1 Putative initiator tRNA phosphoribosyl-transferase [Heterostelium album PN500]|eukprot:XP_020436825.1 Putative initiator tRNA phosphoribosyl-transferase [Heterostelium album PN500]